jgi:hypothetical protein
MITIQFSATAGLAAEAIKIFSRGWASHVDVVLDDGTLLGARSETIGTIPPGVQIRPVAYEKWTRTQTVKLMGGPGLEGDFHDFLWRQIGKPYDELAIVAFVVQRDWRSEGSWICSELVAAALEHCRWFPKRLADIASEVTPRDLLLTLSPWDQTS